LNIDLGFLSSGEMVYGSTGASFLNRTAAKGYLYMVGKLDSFATVEGFQLNLGISAKYIHNNSLSAAEGSRWFTDNRFSNYSSAFNSLGLD
jgi:hypothetical protein